MISAKEYQLRAHETAEYGESRHYPYLMLVEEIGELTGKIAKHVRKRGADDYSNWTPAEVEAILKEVGDVLWGIAEIMTTLNISMRVFSDDLKVKRLAPIDVVAEVRDALYWGVKVLKKGTSKRPGSALDVVDNLLIIEDKIGAVARFFGSSLEAIAEANLNKLADRAKRGVIKGEGDNR